MDESNSDTAFCPVCSVMRNRLGANDKTADERRSYRCFGGQSEGPQRTYNSLTILHTKSVALNMQSSVNCGVIHLFDHL